MSSFKRNEEINVCEVRIATNLRQREAAVQKYKKQRRINKMALTISLSTTTLGPVSWGINIFLFSFCNVSYTKIFILY